MKRLALLGGDLSYSKSREIHAFIAGELGLACEYTYAELKEGGDLNEAAKRLFEFDGFNVTVPYKEKIIPYLNSLDGGAKSCGSVNTVISKDKRGYSTDGQGFLLMLESEGIELKSKKVLLLGSGGAAKSCVKGLADAGAELFVYNRTYENALKMRGIVSGITILKYQEVKKYDIIVNTTVLGSTKYPSEMPVGEEIIALSDTLVDMIYNPKKTKFLNCGEGLGKKCVNGLKMLFFQAYFADMLFFGLEASKAQAVGLYNKFLSGGII